MYQEQVIAVCYGKLERFFVPANLMEARGKACGAQEPASHGSFESSRAEKARRNRH